MRPAAILLAILPLQAPDTAGRRLRGEAHAIGARVRAPRETHNSTVGRLDENAFRARAAEVARELAGDLRKPDLIPRLKYDALEGLRQIGPLASGVVPTLLAELHTHDQAEDKHARVAYFCEMTRTLAKVAPQDPAVIRALAEALDREPNDGRTCHRCGCALEALAAAGPAAREIAGATLERFAREPSRAGSNQLEKAIEATGGAAGMVATLLTRARSQDVLIDDRAASLRALAKSHDQLDPAEKNAVRAAAEALLFDKYWQIRAAAAELLGRAGPAALDRLAQGLDDPIHEVRAASVRALARLGPAAAPVRGRLIAALDPFLGTGEAAAEALVAMGPVAAADVDAAARAAPRHTRPLVEATARGVRAGSMAPVREALSRANARAGEAGYADVEILAAGQGKAYDPTTSRVKARIRGGPYTPAGPPPPTIDYTLTADHVPNALFAALAGRRAGDRLRVRLSPEANPDPYAGFGTPRPSSITEFPVGSGGEFEVEILRVCEPVVWTLFKGGGIFSPIAFETHCR